MRVLVVYESMYGNTRAIGEAIGRGLRAAGEVRVVPVSRATPDLVAGADLLIVGGPTHMHGMAREKTRSEARERAAAPDSGLILDPDAGSSPGLAEWLQSLPRVQGPRAAAFDTRVGGSAWLTGRASSAIGARLRRKGFHLVASTESFLIERPAQLVTGELERAERWGAGLVPVLAPAS